MTAFRPLDDTMPIWIDVGIESSAHVLPIDAGTRTWAQSACAMRLASSLAGEDVLLAFGRFDVVVDPATAILFPAGSLETLGLGINVTHIAVMRTGSQPTRLNIACGTGE